MEQISTTNYLNHSMKELGIYPYLLSKHDDLQLYKLTNTRKKLLQNWAMNYLGEQNHHIIYGAIDTPHASNCFPKCYPLCISSAVLIKTISTNVSPKYVFCYNRNAA